jgi:hypothetical protein
VSVKVLNPATGQESPPELEAGGGGAGVVAGGAACVVEGLGA